MLCQLSPLLWDVFGLVISSGSIVGGGDVSNEHLSFMILFPEKAYHFEKFGKHEAFETLLFIKVYFTYKLSV